MPVWGNMPGAVSSEALRGGRSGVNATVGVIPIQDASLALQEGAKPAPI